MPGGNPLQQSGKFRPLRSIQPGAYCFIVSACHLADGAQHFSARVGQPQRINAPVLGIRLTDHKPPLFQSIHHRHQSAGVHVQGPRQVLLTDTRRVAKKPKNACVTWSELQRDQGFGKLLRRAGTHLRQEKCDGGARSVGPFGFHKTILHVVIIT